MSDYQEEFLRYGDDEIRLKIAGAESITHLTENPTEPIEDVAGALFRALDQNAIGCAPLREQVTRSDQVTIVISDVTRMWMHQDKITELLILYLHEEIGVAYDNMAVLVALGTHRPQTDEEMRRTASDFAVAHVRCVNHSSRAEDLVEIGTTRRGTRVRVNPWIVGRKVILVGGTVFHLLAGFGGGRKSIVPGVSGWDTIQQNHRLALDPTVSRVRPEVELGRLADNPVHLDMLEAAKMAAPVYSINLVVNSAGQYVGILGGDVEAAWLESCALARRTFGVPIDAKYDVVIASAGGYPKDINLYQGSKTLINAMQAIRPGGTVFYIAECREGGGPKEFFDWIGPLAEGRLDAALRENFTIAGFIFYMLCAFARQAQVHMLTSLDAAQAGTMGIKVVRGVAELEKFDFSGKRVAVMPFGANVVPLFRKS